MFSHLSKWRSIYLKTWIAHIHLGFKSNWFSFYQIVLFLFISILPVLVLITLISPVDNMASPAVLLFPPLSLTSHSPHCKANWPYLLFKSLVFFRMAKSESIMRPLRLLPLSSLIPSPSLCPSSQYLSLPPQGFCLHLPLAQGFSVLSLLAFWARLILYYGDCPVIIE